jgi:glucosyl-3-phosphoglycerate phosphatase
VSRTLVLLRHGRTAWNAAGRVQGQLDVPLDEVGRAQAASAASALAALGPVALWSSDLARARETTSYVADATGLPPYFEPRLREFSFGEREGLTHDEYRDEAPGEYAAFRRGDYDVIPTAERISDVRTRMTAALADLLATIEPGQTALAVSHGAAIRVATAALLDWPDQQFHTLRGLDNCGWVVLREHPEHGLLRLEAYNRLAPVAGPEA